MHNALNAMDLTGEYEDRNFVVTRGDSRISVTIARNKETVRLDRTNRFIIDDVDSPSPLAYALTKPLKLGSVYNKTGVFKFVLQEVVRTVNDIADEGIADYYQHFVDSSPEPQEPKPVDNEGRKKVWL